VTPCVRLEDIANRQGDVDLFDAGRRFVFDVESKTAKEVIDVITKIHAAIFLFQSGPKNARRRSFNIWST
jgi:hypothetical protein